MVACVYHFSTNHGLIRFAVNKETQQVDLNDSPSSSLYTPYVLDISPVLSASNGMFMLPRPPCFRGVFTHAKWEKCESVEQATTYEQVRTN